VQGGRRPIRQSGGQYVERLCTQCLDGLTDRREIVERVLQPCRQRNVGFALNRFGILRFGKIEQVGDETLLVHAIGASGFVARNHDAAVFRGPLRRLCSCGAVALHAGRQDPEVRRHVLLPVHVAARENQIPVADIERSRARVCRCCKRRRGHRESGYPGEKTLHVLVVLVCSTRSHRKRARMSMLFSFPILSNVEASHSVAEARPALNRCSRNSGSILNLLTAPSGERVAGSLME